MKIGKQKLILGVLALGFFSFSSGAVAQNADIIWTGAQAITGDSDVFTGGTLVDAFNLGDPDVQAATVGTTTFQAFAFPASLTATTFTAGNYTFTASTGVLTSYNALGSGVGTYSSLTAGYQSLLSSAGGSSPIGSTLTLTISGLTVGQEYVFQFFTNNSASGSGQATSASSLSLSISLDDNATNTAGDVGQFAIGTFTAASTSQTIDFAGAGIGDMPTINAFQLQVVPEPSSILMMLAGAGGLAALMRFRRQRSR